MLGNNGLWYFLPALVATSLVYAAARHERMGAILAHALRACVWILAFIVPIAAVLQWVSWRL